MERKGVGSVASPTQSMTATEVMMRQQMAAAAQTNLSQLQQQQYNTAMAQMMNSAANVAFNPFAVHPPPSTLHPTRQLGIQAGEGRGRVHRVCSAA